MSHQIKVAVASCADWAWIESSRIMGEAFRDAIGEGAESHVHVPVDRAGLLAVLGDANYVLIHTHGSKKDCNFDTKLQSFFIHYGVMAYHHATCLRAYHQKERENRSFFAYHHALACISSPQAYIINRRLYRFRNDDIQGWP